MSGRIPENSKRWYRSCEKDTIGKSSDTSEHEKRGTDKGRRVCRARLACLASRRACGVREEEQIGQYVIVRRNGKTVRVLVSEVLTSEEA